MSAPTSSVCVATTIKWRSCRAPRSRDAGMPLAESSTRSRVRSASRSRVRPVSRTISAGWSKPVGCAEVSLSNTALAVAGVLANTMQVAGLTACLRSNRVSCTIPLTESRATDRTRIHFDASRRCRTIGLASSSASRSNRSRADASPVAVRATTCGLDLVPARMGRHSGCTRRDPARGGPSAWPDGLRQPEPSCPCH